MCRTAGSFDALVWTVEDLDYTFELDQFEGRPDGPFSDVGVTDHGRGIVSIRSSLRGWQRVETLAHEIGHLILSADDHTTDEIQADAVAYLLCLSFGHRSQAIVDHAAAALSWYGRDECSPDWEAVTGETSLVVRAGELCGRDQELIPNGAEQIECKLNLRAHKFVSQTPRPMTPGRSELGQGFSTAPSRGILARGDRTRVGLG